MVISNPSNRRQEVVSLAGCGWSNLQLLRHEVMLVSGRMILERSKDPISKFFVERSRLKTEGVQECIRAAALQCVKFRTLHQFPAKATPSRRRSYGERSNV